MSKQTDHFRTQIRIPADIRDKLVEAAESSGRSMNAEIVNCLETSLLAANPKVEDLTAEQARQLKQQALIDGYATFYAKCIEDINERARQGYGDTYVTSGYDEWDDGDDIEVKVIEPVKAKLESLGYTVEEFDAGFHIKF